MALAGSPLIARFEGRKSGHATNNALLRALFADPANYDGPWNFRRLSKTDTFPDAAAAAVYKGREARPVWAGISD